MNDTRPNLALLSTLRANGELDLTLAESPMPSLKQDDEIIVQMLAAPINPSDMGVMLGPVDPATAKLVETDGGSATRLQGPPAAAAALGARLDKAMPVGNEGAGRVISAGSEAQGLIGRLVAIRGGGMYVRYRKVRAADALVLPDDATPAQGAAAFINPMTALGMIETMRLEGFTALVHTAAASNLGQMLCRLCRAEGVGLVNIVRSPQQAALLRGIGAEHVCDSSAPGFMDDLETALRATGATLAFDAIGGGPLAGQILSAMEKACTDPDANYSHYGSGIPKKVYIYGGLNTGPTEFRRSFGMAWSMGGWLLFPILQRVGPERAAQLKQRVAAELKTTFASAYGQTISLEQAVEPEVLKAYARRETGGKYLIDLSR